KFSVLTDIQMDPQEPAECNNPLIGFTPAKGNSRIIRRNKAEAEGSTAAGAGTTHPGDRRTVARPAEKGGAECRCESPNTRTTTSSPRIFGGHALRLMQRQQGKRPANPAHHPITFLYCRVTKVLRSYWYGAARNGTVTKKNRLTLGGPDGPPKRFSINYIQCIVRPRQPLGIPVALYRMHYEYVPRQIRLTDCPSHGFGLLRLYPLPGAYPLPCHQ